MSPDVLELIVYDAIRHIRDPEFPDSSLEDLHVVEEGKSVSVTEIEEDGGPLLLVSVEFKPTVATCTMTSIIGLCLLEQLMRVLGNEPYRVKFKVSVASGSHNDAESISRQLQDKERVAAALENPSVREVIRSALK